MKSIIDLSGSLNHSKEYLSLDKLMNPTSADNIIQFLQNHSFLIYLLI